LRLKENGEKNAEGETMIRAALILLATLVGGPLFAWWWPAVPGLVAGFWKPARPAQGFFLAALGGALAWAAVALWFDARNDGLLSARIASLFLLPGSAGLILATAMVGGITAGLGSLFGARFRRFWASLHEALAEVDVPVPEEDAGSVG
jgi:hypothetical protein